MSDTVFDYIVVGAGSAGAVLANRLVKAGKTVLLLEAGPKDNNPLINMPGGTQEVLKNKKLNWYLDSEPQTHLNNRRLMQHRGKMLGGSSNLNGMVAIRGNQACYDHWQALGNDGWSYQEVLKNFKAIENWGEDNDYHSSHGELPIRKTLGESLLFDRFIEAGVELGLPRNEDFNGKTQDGVGRYHANVYQGQRWGSARTFLKPLKNNPKLRIETDIQVEKVLIENNKAVGVRAHRKGQSLTFKTRGEVILSGGAFASPQLLLLSGIGSAQKLQGYGIEVVKDLPGVGENLQDHLSFLLNYGCSLPITMNGPANNLFQQMKIAFQYFVQHKGLGALNMIEAGGFWYTKEGLSAPDFQMHVVPTLMYNLIDKPPKQHGVSIRACVLNPYSRGTVDLHSANPLAKPRIDFRFLSDERDLDVAVAIFKFMKKIMHAKAWQGILSDEVKGADQAKDDAEIIAFIRQYIETDYHPVGTCKMGPESDAMAVVDNHLRVYGVKGLRVADASIMPTIVRGNTNIPCMMIGDKAAQWILADAQR